MLRFWKDADEPFLAGCIPDNEIGIRLYESLGMHRDGVLRQNYKAERGYLIRSFIPFSELNMRRGDRPLSNLVRKKNYKISSFSWRFIIDKHPKI